MRALPSRTAQRLKASIAAERRELFRQFMDDMQFLLLRPEEEGFIRDQMRSVRYRRQWVEERELHERQRKAR